MLYIEPIGGLCNRLRAINSAVRLGVELDQKVVVLWNAKKELNCYFTDLFLPMDKISVVERKQRSAFSYLLKRYLGSTYLKEEKVAQMKRQTGAISAADLKEQRNIYFHTGYQFYHTSDYPELFQPVDSIAKRVEHIQSKWPARMVGVHVRRTDNKNAIAVSTMDGFCHAMEQELQENPQTGFYVASDAKEVQNDLRARFGACVFFQESVPLTRSSRGGMEAALVDLLCLAATAKILGSYWSSFSDLAAEWYGIPKEIIKT